MPGQRFNLSLLSNLQSRDGGITKGALTRNGFVEKQGTEGWAWQRPGLAPGVAAPLTGGYGLGMYVEGGTALYGVYTTAGGTATSAQAFIPGSLGQGTFTLVAAALLGGANGYGYIVDGTNTTGSLSPSTWGGIRVDDLTVGTSTASSSAGPTAITLGTGLRQNAFNYIAFNGQTFYSNQVGLYGSASGSTEWDWYTLPLALTSAGTYTGSWG